MQLALYQAITHFALDLIEPCFDDNEDKYILEALWETIRPQLYANHQRYLNGQKGGAPNGNQNARKKQPKNNQKQPNVNDNVNVKEDDNVDENSSNQRKFVKPSIEEIEEYCQQCRFTSVNAPAFYDYYESKGWIVGKSPMKDWKAAIRNWNRNHSAQSESSTRSTNPRIEIPAPKPDEYTSTF